MSQIVQAGFDGVLRGSTNDSDGVTTLSDAWQTGLNLAAIGRSLANGTGANKANKAWRKQSTLAAAANDDWVLNGGSNIKDRFGNAINFTKLKWVAIRLTNAATGLKLRLGNAGANPWPGWFGATNQTEDVQVQMFKFDDIDGWSVSANHTLRVNNPSASSVTYDIWLIGE